MHRSFPFVRPSRRTCPAVRRVVVHNGWVASLPERDGLNPEVDVDWRETNWPRARTEASLAAWVRDELKPTVGDLDRKEPVRIVIASEDLWTDIHTPSDQDEDPLSSTKRFLGHRLPYPPDRIEIRACTLGQQDGRPVLFVTACRTGMLGSYAKAFTAGGVAVRSIEPAVLHALNHQRAVLTAQGINRADYVTEAGDHALRCEWEDSLPRRLNRRKPPLDGAADEREAEASANTTTPTIVDAPRSWWSGKGQDLTPGASAIALRRPWIPKSAVGQSPSMLAWQAAAGGSTW